MNVAFVAEQARLDGTLRMMLRQAAWLEQQGHRTFIAAADGPFTPQIAAAGIAFLPLQSLRRSPIANPAQRTRDTLRLRHALDTYDIHAIVAAARMPFPLSYAAADGKIPVILDILSGDCVCEADAATAAFVAAAIRQRRVIAHTIDDAFAHARVFDFDPRDVLLAPLPLDPAPSFDQTTIAVTRRSLGVVDDELLALTVARLDDDHVGYIQPFADAVAKLRADGTRIRGIVVGDGTYSGALRAAAPDGVRYVGRRDDIEALYASADIYVGEGSSMLEAARAKCPTIAACAQAIPAQADRAFALLGVHTSAHMRWFSTPLTPTSSYHDALALLAGDPILRGRIARHVARRFARWHDTERYMRWLLQVLAGEHPAPLLAIDEPAATAIEIDGTPAQLKDAARLLRASRNVGIASRRAISWNVFSALESEDWEPLAIAARRPLAASAARMNLGGEAE